MGGYYSEIDADFGDELRATEALAEIQLEKYEKERELLRKINKLNRNPAKGLTVNVRCEHCDGLFSARVADRKRGWGRFCSKSCKAKFSST